MREFEYKFEVGPGEGKHDSPESAMNELGAMGWELVSVVSTHVPAGKGQPTLLYFFKREKSLTTQN
jgi:hypothetical protein